MIGADEAVLERAMDSHRDPRRRRGGGGSRLNAMP
jgi:hypothetical protein